MMWTSLVDGTLTGFENFSMVTAPISTRSTCKVHVTLKLGFTRPFFKQIKGTGMERWRGTCIYAQRWALIVSNALLSKTKLRLIIKIKTDCV